MFAANAREEEENVKRMKLRQVIGMVKSVTGETEY
jgi:hypothetical protein